MSGTLSQDLFKAISIHGLVQERRTSIANALELCLSCTKPSITIWNLCESWRFSLSFLLQCWHGSSRNPHFNILWMTSVNIYENCETFLTLLKPRSWKALGWVGLWGYLWWAPSAKRKDHHGVSSGWNSVWHHSNTGLSSTQYEQIPIIHGVWPFWLTPFFFRSITFWRAYGLNCISSVEITLFLLADILLQHRALFQC